MCATCGCEGGAGVRYTALTATPPADHPGGARVHDHPHDHHPHDHPHDHGGQVISLEARLLGRNDELAARNRAWLGARRVVAVNLMSSPGSGKTTLLERTVRELGDRVAVSVIEGDQETPLDAERIRATGAPVVQVNTGAGCHLDAAMVGHAARALDPPEGSVLLVENVGNLVCPAMFDLGERARVVIMSVTEGEDKPLKYPHMFRAADVVVLTKSDLAPHVDFDAARFADAVAMVNPPVEVRTLSARTGAGMDGWYAYLQSLREG